MITGVSGFANTFYKPSTASTVSNDSKTPDPNEKPNNVPANTLSKPEPGLQPRPDEKTNKLTTNQRIEQELSQSELRQVQTLQTRDREVRNHEQAHLSAAGTLSQGGASFSYSIGPNGKRYATGGEVSIDTSKINGDPQATINKAEQIQRAALAPATPSQQDRRVATRAISMAQEARVELTTNQQVEMRNRTEDKKDATTDKTANETSSANTQHENLRQIEQIQNNHGDTNNISLYA